MTNREWLRSLTDEELADFFIDDRRSLNGEIFGERDCTYGIRKWLQLKDTSRQY